MSSKRNSDGNDSERNKRSKISKLEPAPNINSLDELVKLAASFKLYKNIDSVALYTIYPDIAKLNAMVGMDKLKQTVFYQILYYLQGMHKKNQNDEYIHTVIIGPPGSGKTTVAHHIANIYKNLGILSKSGDVKLVHRDDFIAGYVGQTAIKTKKLLNSSLGGVLFIDEAYSLGGVKEDSDSFVKEAMDTLVSFLSEHKNDFCCIIAGYEEDIKKYFFSMNKGLARRFPWVHKIDESSPENLAEIFFLMIKSINWSTDVKMKTLVDLFSRNKDHFKHGGGDVETFIGKSKIVHSKRVFNQPQSQKFILTIQDLHNAIAMIKENKLDEPDTKNLGFMYT